MTSVAEQLVWHLGPIVEPSLVLGVIENWHFGGPLDKLTGVAHSNEVYCLQNPLGFCSSFGSSRRQMQ